ncbi:MAG TPA: YihY/virulence factor BrkB family protein [Steroidobacteraceae bacterium]|nr:YihY/virulence factor BrkB family protein [Steroidobacteraceae bacterium]
MRRTMEGYGRYHGAMWVRFWSFLDRLFFGPASIGPQPPAALVRLLRYPYAVLRDLWRGDINLRAMGLVYTTLLSIIPLIAFAFAVLKGFGAHRDLEPVVYEFFRPMGPAGAAEITTRIMQFADGVSSGVVGSVGFALLLWTLLGTIKKVEDSFNFLWRVEQPRSFARRVAEYVSMLIIGPILLVGFIGLTHAALNGPLGKITGLPILQQLNQLAIRLSPYVMVTTFFTVLYMFVPNTRVRFRPALAGALAAGVLWAAVGKMFTAMVVLSTRLTIVYAGFAFIVAALLWTYFGWIILLAGTQLSFYIQNPSYLRIGLQELRLSSIEIEQLALRVMYLVGRTHMSGGQRWTINRLAAELGLPGIAIAQLGNALEKAGLLIVTEDDEFVPARDISRIGVQEILEVARSQRSGHFAPRELKIAAIDKLTASLDAAWHECCAGRTLRDLIEEPG